MAFEAGIHYCQHTTRVVTLTINTVRNNGSAQLAASSLDPSDLPSQTATISDHRQTHRPIATFAV